MLMIGCLTKQHLKKNLFVPRLPNSVPGLFIRYICTIFGRMPGIEPELLRLQPDVLPMSFTHPWMSYTHPSHPNPVTWLPMKKNSCYPNSCYPNSLLPGVHGTDAYYIIISQTIWVLCYLTRRAGVVGKSSNSATCENCLPILGFLAWFSGTLLVSNLSLKGFNIW